MINVAVQEQINSILQILQEIDNAISSGQVSALTGLKMRISKLYTAVLRLSIGLRHVRQSKNAISSSLVLDMLEYVEGVLEPGRWGVASKTGAFAATYASP